MKKVCQSLAGFGSSATTLLICSVVGEMTALSLSLTGGGAKEVGFIGVG